MDIEKTRVTGPAMRKDCAVGAGSAVWLLFSIAIH
jgi:hypothetical protein